MNKRKKDNLSLEYSQGFKVVKKEFLGFYLSNSYNDSYFRTLPMKATKPQKKDIWKMFDRISPTYDRINRTLSFGIDQLWRKKVAELLPDTSPLKLLDLASGTADQIIAIIENAKSEILATGIDLAQEMLAIGQKKVKEKAYSDRVELLLGDAERIDYPDETFDCVTMSFGIRNVENIDRCLSEIHRVLKPGGRSLILEFSLPKNILFRKAHLFYLRRILPSIGGFLSKDRDAYAYLNRTIETFPEPKEFSKRLKEKGFSSTKTHPLTFGIVTIYQADK